MENVNKITSYLMGVCENNNIPYTHKVLANYFNCFYVDYNSLTFEVIQMVNDLSKVNNYHLNTENAVLNTLKDIINEQAMEIAMLKIEVENLKNTSKKHLKY